MSKVPEVYQHPADGRVALDFVDSESFFCVALIAATTESAVPVLTWDASVPDGFVRLVPDNAVRRAMAADLDRIDDILGEEIGLSYEPLVQQVQDVCASLKTSQDTLALRTDQCANLRRRAEYAEDELESATEALASAGVPIGPGMTTADAIRTLADTPVDDRRPLDPSSPDDLRAAADMLDAIVEHPAEVHGYSLLRLRDVATDLRSEADAIERKVKVDALRARKIDAMAQAIRKTHLRPGHPERPWESISGDMRDIYREQATSALDALEAMEAGQ